MASLALGIVGGVIGSFFGMGAIGFSIGSMLGNLLFPAKGPDGPRLSNLHLQNSTYGGMIPILYGTMRLGGNVIWQADLIEHEHHSSGKGGPEQTTFSYGGSFAVDLCEGPIDGISKIWADGTLIWGETEGPGGPLPCTVYLGTEDQLPDPTMEAELGVGNVPANRGKAYVVFSDWDLTDFGNRIPNLNFEVRTKGGLDSPITRVAEYHDEPHTDSPSPLGNIDRWSFRWTEGPVGRVYPAITHWAFDGSDIRIRVVPYTDVDENGGVVFTYDNPSLVANGSNHDFDEYPYITSVSESSIYYPIGIYHYAGGGTTPLWWLQSATRVVAPGTDNAAIGATAITADPNTSELSFAYEAGILAGEFVQSCSLSQDGTILLVMTAPTSSGAMDKWYKIIDGDVTSQGAVLPTINAFLGVGNAGANLFDCNMLENSGDVMWHFSADSGVVDLYRITSGVFAKDTEAGSADTADPGYSRPGQTPPNSGRFYPSIYVPATGFAGVCLGTTLALFSRFAGNNPTTLAEIVSDISLRAGLTEDEIDVTELTDIVDGYTISNQQTCRDNIAPLRSAYYFDAVESGGVVKFVKRGHEAIVTIPDVDLAAQKPGDAAPSLVSKTRAQEVDLPAIVNISYVNGNNDYQIGTQISQRQVVASELTIGIQLPISMTDAKAKQIANTLLFTAWIERRSFSFSLSRKYAYLEPTDIVVVHGYEIRIMSKTDGAGGIMQFDGIASVSGIWAQTPMAVLPIGFTSSLPPSVPQVADLILLDIPMVDDSDDPEGFHAGMAGSVSPAWKGGALFQSLDGGANFTDIASTHTATTMGTVTAIPASTFEGGNVFDEGNVFEVTIGAGGGELTSANETAVLNGANIALCGPEIIQFKNATLTGAGVYELTGLLRGRRGTEWAISQHAAGEVFAYLPTTIDVDASFAQLGQTLYYAGVTFGTPLSSAVVVPFVDNGQALLPYSPVQLGGGTNAAGDVTLTWIRRSRTGGAWNNFGDVPLGEASEQYVVQIWDSAYAACARVITGLTSPTCAYTSAQQVTDFGAQQQTVYFTVGQVGQYRLGRQGFGTAVGAGSTDDDVIAPVTPYNEAPSPPPGTGCTLPVTADTLVWDDPDFTDVVNNTFAPGQEWVVSFTTPASATSSIGLIFGGSTSGAPATTRHATLSASPCGLPLAAQSSQSGTSFALRFYMTGNPDPVQFPTLATSTTYYVSITTDTASPMGLELQFIT